MQKDINKPYNNKETIKLNQKNILLEMILYTISGVFLCSLTGFMLLGSRIFVYKDPAFQFVAFGIYGSITFAFIKFRTLRDVIFVSIIIILLDLFIFQIRTPMTIFVRILYFTLLILSIFYYHNISKKFMSNLKLGKFIFLGGLYALCFGLMLLILSLIFKDSPAKSLIESQITFSLFIGSGLGLGFELYEILRSKIQNF